ncbi:hypothetical protein DV096_09945 [Bradymonadaceae bacterium TMQ3]|uniref:DUF5666 domain-containing protein n=1 Tax=Lujinxingia sediminis TaxID=2480984 RepID=A0ABY0CS70_9DELT|nr:hypothetical protein [Lujinxingia sediminis]RDV38127.1 hypothetical protein DV096_09945 [Bradymonadaceae bacterium TMQ3]RVU43673.1 hypothetical protein EA187_12675 [Lujinxingia sediminis]TXC75798.1 hypothetical protein FRC91_09850 [Bradymonadales bacterium TMQ1]
MMTRSRSTGSRQLPVGALVALTLVGATACVEPELGEDPADYFSDGEYGQVQDPIAFSTTPYDFTGEVPIEDVKALYPDEVVWFGFSPGEPYPVSGDCDPERDWDQTVPATLNELPAVIEGVVTTHPRYFQKVTVCGIEQRYYGSYTLEDASGGILVLKDSRLAEFDIGDRVRIKVRGIMKNFDSLAVLSYSEEEVINTPDARIPVHFEEVERHFSASEDVYQVRRVTGRVVLEPTNQNFNEMRLQSLEDPSVEWLVSLDAELGRRGVGPKLGEVVQVTAPVINSFGVRLLITALGQLERIEE